MMVTSQPLSLLSSYEIKRHIGYSLVTDDTEVQAVCEYLSTETLLAIDTETYSNGKRGPAIYYTDKVEQRLWISDPWLNHVRLVQIRSRDSDSFLFDLQQLSDYGLQCLRDLINKPDITWVGHNLKFDYKMLAINLDARFAKVYDTMVATIIIGHATGDKAMWARGVGLKDVVRDLLDCYLDKTEQMSNWGARALTDNQLQYAADDLLYLFDLYDTLSTTIEADYGMAGGAQLEMDVLPCVAELELAGIHFDVELYRRVQRAARYYLPTLEEALCAFINWPMIAVPPMVRIRTGRLTMPKPSKFEGETKSPLDSQKFMLAKLRELGIPLDNLKGDHLESMSDGYPILKELIAYKDLVKQLSLNYEDWIHPVTGKIHSELNQNGASTGRFTSNNPNLQQVPKMVIPEPDTKEELCYRYCFIVPDGWLMASADYSGQELRVMAVLSSDPNLVRIHDEEYTPPYVPAPDGKLNDNGTPVLVKNMAADVHAASCELVFSSHGITCWNAKTTPYPGGNGKTYRDVIKTVVYGLAYGKSSEGLAKDMGKEAEEVKKTIIDPFFKPYKTLKRWLDERGEESNTTRMALYGVPETGIVRLRMVNSDRHSDKGALRRAGMNTPIQGTSALMLKMAMVVLVPRILSMGGAVCGSIHDELLVRFPAERKTEFRAAIDEGMRVGSNTFLRGVVTDKWGIGIDTHWSKD